MLESPYKKPFVIPPHEHPRLMLRRADIPKIKESLENPEFSEAKDVFEELCLRPVTGRGATPEYGSYDLAEVLTAEALAFRALLSSEKADAEKAVGTLMLLLDSFVITGGNMGARWGGHLIFTASQVYDWCYSFLS